MKKNSVPTYDELSAMYAESSARVAALEREAVSLRQRNASLEGDVGKLAEALAAVSSELGDKETIIKRLNCERFYSKRDSVYKDAARAAERASKGKAGGSKRGRKKGTANFMGMDLEALSAKSEPIIEDAAMDVPEGERGFLVRVGEDESYLIELVRSRVSVRKVIRPSYATPDGRMIQRPSPAPISGSPAGASLLADLQATKYGLGVPCYRYRGWLAMSGVQASSQLITKWVVGAASAEGAVYDEIMASLPSSGAVEAHVDETPIEMVGEETESGKLGKKGYMFAMSADGPMAKLRSYAFSKKRETDPTVDGMLKGFKGVLTCDGYVGYDRFSKGGPIQRCLAHSRRKYADVAKTGSARASAVCDLFDAVFADERAIRESGAADPAAILKARGSEANKSHVAELEAAIAEDLKSEPEKSPLWCAASYFSSMRGELLTFMSDGRASADNNAVERCCKKVALARKAFLFVQGERGGQAAAVALTLMETAAANGVEPRGYLEWVLKNQRESNSNPSKYLPWSPSVPDSIKLKGNKKAS
jgi:hypothetical protein